MSPSAIEPLRAAASLAARLGLPPWLHRRTRHTVYVDTAAFWVYGPNGSAPQRAESWAGWCEAHTHASVDLVFAGALTHQFIICDPTLLLVDDGDLVAWARQQFVQVHGASAQAWPLVTWVDGFHYIACALHGIDLPELKHLAVAAGIRIRHMQPWWSLAFAAATRRAPAWIVHDRQVLILADGVLATIVRCEGGRPVAVMQRRLAAHAAGGLAPLVHEAATWHGLGAGATLVITFCRDGLAHPVQISAELPWVTACPYPPRDWVCA